MTVNMWIASIAWCILTLGLLNRSRPSFHVPLVLTAILIDVCLVLYLQLTREAIQQALEFDRSLLQQVHIGFSSLALLGYIPTVFLGFKLLRDPTRPQALRLLHRRVALTTYALRTLGFLCMFSMWQS